MRLRLPLTLLGILAVTGMVFAAGEVGGFNFNETTGLINIPSAKVAPAGSLTVGPQFANIRGPGLGLKDQDDSLFRNDGGFRGIFGVSKNVEISITAIHRQIRRLLFGAKWLVLEDDFDHPAVAVGVQSINSFADDNSPHPRYFDTVSAFVVVGHEFHFDNGMSIEFHGGAGTGRLRNGFVGTELHLDPTWSLIAEHDGTIQSIGVRIRPHDRWELMPVLQYHPVLDQLHPGFQFSYRFGNTGVPETTEPEEEPASQEEGPVEKMDDSVPAPAQPEEPTQDSFLDVPAPEVSQEGSCTVEPGLTLDGGSISF